MNVKIFVIEDVDRMMLVTVWLVMILYAACAVALFALHGAMTFTEHCAPLAS